MNLTTWFMFGILLIMIMSLISNTSPTALQRIQYQFDRLNCPFPLFTGQDQLIINGELAFGVNVTRVQNGDGTINGTRYICAFDPLSGPNGATVFTVEYVNYQETCFGFIPCGWFTYAGDFLTKVADKFESFFSLIVYILTPINFDIMGFTLSDLDGLSLAIVIGIYIFAYIGIGAFFAGYISGLVSRFV